MIEVNVMLSDLHLVGLDLELRTALGEKCHGVSTYGAERPISIWLDDSASEDDIATATGIAANHDPVKAALAVPPPAPTQEEIIADLLRRIEALEGK